MLKVKSREFFRQPYKYLKDLPIVVTRGGIKTYIIMKYMTEKEIVMTNISNPVRPILKIAEFIEQAKDHTPNIKESRKQLEEFDNSFLTKDNFTAKGKKRK